MLNWDIYQPKRCQVPEHWLPRRRGDSREDRAPHALRDAGAPGAPSGDALRAGACEARDLERQEGRAPHSLGSWM